MVDFSNYASKKINEGTLAEYVFRDIEGEPSIWFAPATEANRPFFSHSLRERAARVERESRKASDDSDFSVKPEDIADQRQVDRVAFAKFCAKRWGTPPVDTGGNAVEFNEANALAFFEAIPEWIFDALRPWIANPRNFTPKAATVAQADRLGKSSPRG